MEWNYKSMNYVKKQKWLNKQKHYRHKRKQLDSKPRDYEKAYTNKKFETFDFQYLCSYLSAQP